MLHVLTARCGAMFGAALGAALLFSACTGTSPTGGQLGGQPGSSQPPPPANAIGTGPVKVALILPLTASGNAGSVGQSMRNAAELAMSQFTGDLQVLTRDDAGNPATAQQVAQQATEEGSEIILGPLFSPAVQSVGQVARARNIPVIAFS